MPHKSRKIRKLRGSRTCGYGIVGQHRGSGSRGGRGKSGGHKHHWTHVVKYEPKRFRKIGFRSRGRFKEVKVINVSQLDEIAFKTKGRIPKGGRMVINLAELGFDKLLGKGGVQKPYLVKVPSFSKTAKTKIESVGGEIELS